MYSARKCDFHLTLISISTKHTIDVNASKGQNLIQETVLICGRYTWFSLPSVFQYGRVVPTKIEAVALFTCSLRSKAR